MEISFHTPISISTNLWTKKRFLTKMFLATCIFFFKKQFVKIYFFGNKYFLTESNIKIMKNAFFSLISKFITLKAGYLLASNTHIDQYLKQ